MVDHTQIRIALWTLRAALLSRAQRADRKAEKREMQAAQWHKNATECRSSAEQLATAAEEFGHIDKGLVP